MKIIRETDEKSLQVALDYLKSGRVISFATDTIYGLAVDASNENAINKIYKIKSRNRNKPIAIFLPNISKAKEIFLFNELAQKICEKFMPGAITLILKKRLDAKIKIAKNINNNDESIGFRIVDRDFLNSLFLKFEGVLAVTSANISGKENPQSADDVFNSFKDIKEDILLIDGNECKQNIASTVIKVDEKINILREGKIKKEIIENEICN